MKILWVSVRGIQPVYLGSLRLLWDYLFIMRVRRSKRTSQISRTLPEGLLSPNVLFWCSFMNPSFHFKTNILIYIYTSIPISISLSLSNLYSFWVKETHPYITSILSAFFYQSLSTWKFRFSLPMAEAIRKWRNRIHVPSFYFSPLFPLSFPFLFPLLSLCTPDTLFQVSGSRGLDSLLQC